jgi:transcription elongation GreA/GreB family factor
MRGALADVQALAVRACDAAGPVSLGALVETDEDGETGLFWLVPHGGGTRLADGTVQVVTPKSPLGQALLGARPDDECEVVLAGKKRVLCVVRVA